MLLLLISLLSLRMWIGCEGCTSDLGTHLAFYGVFSTAHLSIYYWGIVVVSCLV
jgi:hypothetical protein